MHEIAKVTLENEMDLILAHKRTMKLGEIAGLSLSAQTTFATAVSEVSRNIIEGTKKGSLQLSIETGKLESYIVAGLKDEQLYEKNNPEGLAYAKRLVNKYTVTTKGSETTIELFYYINPGFHIDINKLDEWRSLFRNEPPVSPYDELKKKNEQLQELADKLAKSDNQYKVLTNTLPLIILSVDFSGQLIYANEWLVKYTGLSLKALNATQWKSVIHEEDYPAFQMLFNSDVSSTVHPLNTQVRIKRHDKVDYFWHMVSLSLFMNGIDKPQYWIGYIVDIHAQKVYEETLKDNIELKHAQDELKNHQVALQDTIEELNRSNQELQQFAYIASHDLQEPVRKILFYSDFLMNRYKESLDNDGIGFLKNLQDSGQRMRTLIQDLLSFSLINKDDVAFTDVDLQEMAELAQQDLEIAINEKNAVIDVAGLLSIRCDKRMIRQLFTNMIGNSIKYSKKDIAPMITIRGESVPGGYRLSFKDNGIGFDEKYLPQMLNLFQRLHGREAYEGTGLGLAICRKIAEIHNGKIEAESKEGVGAIFYITLATDPFKN